MTTPGVRTGLDLLPDHAMGRAMRGRRVAALVHHGSVDARLRHAVLVLRDDVGASVRLLLGPEHGLWATHQDMEAVAPGIDPVFGLPVVSLYGETVDSLEPPPGALASIDIAIADLCDIGSRYYTYAATVLGLGRACARRGIPLVVLDRPNPLGGLAVEGCPPGPDYRSFVGALPVPHRHGCTLGELVSLGVRAEGLDLDLHIIGPTGWVRAQSARQTCLPWVPPSPNMPTFEAALLYPGMCLLEGTTLSEGRGTTTPFELAGAPGVDPLLLAVTLNDMKLPGLSFRPHLFRPMFGKHAGTVCGGVQIHILDAIAHPAGDTQAGPATIEALALGAHLLQAFKEVSPAAFGWRKEAYEFVRDRPAIDLLAGDPELRTRIDASAPLAPLLERWRAGAAAFARSQPQIGVGEADRG